MSKHEYSGEPIDASWQTPPWQNDGETLDAYNSDGDGEIMTIDWPENATDPEELNDKQRAMILTTVKYPNVDSPTQLVDLSGLDVHPSYPQNVLEAHWPERFWGANNSEQSDNVGIDPDELRQRLLDGSSLNKLVKEYPVSQARLSRLVRGTADDMPDCDIPPLTYLDNSEQEWVIEESKETGENKRRWADVTTEELRERALNGEHATEIAESLGVTDAPVRRRLRGYDNYGVDSDIPALDFDQTTQEWCIPDETAGEGDIPADPAESKNVETEKCGAPSWVWALVIAAGAWIVSKILR